MLKKVSLGLGAGLALVSGVVAGSAIATSRRKAEVKPERFSAIAKTYDKEVEGTENSSGIETLRANLVKKASGKVLETCAGTGRNNKYYDVSKIKELVLVDASLEMLQEARLKPFAGELEKVRLVKAADLSTFEPQTFDTVVDTFGLCSVVNPEEYLNQIKRVVKPNGKVLLLEHGHVETTGVIARIVNAWLNFRATAHSDYFGCLWNRPIVSLVQNSGLTIDKVEVHHLGTCTEIEARNAS